MLKSKFKKIFVSALAASLVIGCFTVTAFAQKNSTTIISYAPVYVQYSADVQSKGWMPFVSNGQTAGTTGLSLRMQALTVNLTNMTAGTAGISYSVYIQDKGWMPAVSDGETAGPVDQSKRIEAIKISLYGLPGYSVEYRVHVQNIGWMDWQKDGAVAGTTGQSLRMEAIEIRVVAPQLPVSSEEPTYPSYS
jgi:uncharacterized protein YjdB